MSFVLVFGRSYLELVFGDLDRLPEPGEEVYTELFGLSCGGAATVASAVQSVGAQAGLVTTLGTDLTSALTELYCREQGISLEFAKRVGRDAGCVTIALNFSGDRSFVSHCPKAVEQDAREMEARWAEILGRSEADWGYVHAGPRAVQLLCFANQIGCRMVVDVNRESIEKSRADVLRCISLAEIFVPNADELELLTGEQTVARGIAALQHPPPVIVVKCGARGAVVVEDGTSTVVSDGLVDVDVVDRTGAGDSFAGGLLGALATGHSMTEAVRIANQAGSEAVARFGGLGRMTFQGVRFS